MSKKPIAAGKSSFDLIDTVKLFTELELKRGSVFLDMACGSGLYSIAASEYIGSQGRVYALDLWEEGIASLSNEISLRKIDVIFPVVADVSRRIPLDDQSVDVCLMATVLHDLIQDGTDGGALQQVRRVLKPQGLLALIEFKKIDGPPGPPVSLRLSPEESANHLHPYDLYLMRTTDIGEYNYLQIFTISVGSMEL